MKKITTYILVFAFVFLALNNLCYAEEAEEDEVIETTEGVQEEITYPHKQTFKITAYYSPLEGQERYVTGSYEGDIRLNGSGVNSADGTPVYPGMIAAPKSYPFGMKMRIPGVGTVAVHDRGGAIVHAGERNQSYDRLDVWMGYGDIGLNRALNWGARIVECTVYGIDLNVKESVYLEGFSETEKFIQSFVVRPKIFLSDIWYGASGTDVKKLQEFLTDLGYFDDPIDGEFGPSTKEAIYNFQIDFGVVTSIEDFGAGHFGPQTRLKIEAVFDKRKEYSVKKKVLGSGEISDEVKFLQEALKELGYSVDVTGVYDQKTVDAVYKFQLDHKIVNNEYEPGAGHFGPQTYQALVHRLISSSDKTFAKDYKEEAITENGLLSADLKFGDSGPGVLELQNELKNLNFLRIAPTGYFGKVTEHAVFKFQQMHGLVEDMNSLGAGVFGPFTRGKMNKYLAARVYTKRLIAEKNNGTMVAASLEVADEVVDEIAVVVAVPEEPVKEPVFVTDLDYGVKAETVKKLQEILKDMGYFGGMVITNYYGKKTAEAVLAFQMDKGLVTSEDEVGAGRVGPATRELLNNMI